MDEAIKAIVGNAKDSIFAALFVVACVVVLFLYRATEKLRSTHHAELKEEREAREASFEERLADARSVTTALQQSAQANVLLEKSADERTVAIRDLATTISSLVQKNDGQQTAIDRRIEALERSVEVIRDAVLRPQGALR